MKFTLRTVLLAVGVIAVLLSGYRVYRQVYPSHAVGVTPTIANRMGLGIPASATDVTYSVDSFGCDAVFSISEDGFLKWCETNGWPVTEIETPLPFLEAVHLESEHRMTSSGYEFSPPSGRGVYDRDQRRAAFTASAFP